jgi:uncharacterized membrane protein YfcA
MMEEVVLHFAAFVGIGLVSGYLSGLFGIGGGIVRIPVFIYLFPLFGIANETLMHVALGTSVALVVPTAVTATRKQVKLGHLDFGYYRLWAVGVFIGVCAGLAILPHVSTDILKLIFIGFLVVLGIYVGFVKDTVVIANQPPTGATKLGVATSIGCAAVLTGTGGGALTTPTLKAFSVPMKTAIAMASATGLVVGMVGTIGFIFHGWDIPGRPSHSLGYVDLPVFLAMLPGTLFAVPLGVRTNDALSQVWLKRIYTLLLFVIAADMSYRLLA